MTHPLITSLERHGPLTDEEKDVIQKIASRTGDYAPGAEIVPEGSTPQHSSLIIEGFSIRHSHFVEGERQITAVHIPGDFADLHSFLLKKMDDGVTALTACKVAPVAHADLLEVTRNYPYLTRALWFTTLVDGAVHRKWMGGIGRQTPKERLAHFLCEMCARLSTQGLNSDGGYDLPITQEELGDAFGMSTVHTNRTLQELRASGLITSAGKRVTINDIKALQELAEYTSHYLHIDQPLER
jgi:CRP-like cAMP-binding protein